MTNSSKEDPVFYVSKMMAGGTTHIPKVSLLTTAPPDLPVTGRSSMDIVPPSPAESPEETKASEPASEGVGEGKSDAAPEAPEESPSKSGSKKRPLEQSKPVSDGGAEAGGASLEAESHMEGHMEGHMHGITWRSHETQLQAPFRSGAQRASLHERQVSLQCFG